ncbi:hypothetical protein BDV10DRAFT_82248 [Aspergillus recurvatus]
MHICVSLAQLNKFTNTGVASVSPNLTLFLDAFSSCPCIGPLCPGQHLMRRLCAWQAGQTCSLMLLPATARAESVLSILVKLSRLQLAGILYLDCYIRLPFRPLPCLINNLRTTSNHSASTLLRNSSLGCWLISAPVVTLLRVLLCNTSNHLHKSSFKRKKKTEGA